MKTTILNIEPHDDLTSIKDKLTWTKNSRLILVFSNQKYQIHRLLDLKLLERKASKLGIQLAIVSNDLEICENATELRIPVFPSVPQAEKRSWTVKKKIDQSKLPLGIANLLQKRKNLPIYSNKSKSNMFVRFFTLILVILSFFALLIFIFPTTTIILHPSVSAQEVSLKITASNSITQSNLTGAIPAKKLFIEVNGELEKNSTGEVLLPKEKATGQILITNQTGTGVDLIAGTIFRTMDSDPIRFVLDQDTNVDPGIGSIVSAKVTALVPGENGNLFAGKELTIGGVFDSQLLIKTNNVFSGGASEIFSSPTEEDYTQIEKILTANLREKAIQDWANETGAEIVLIPESISIDRVINQDRLFAVGSPSDLVKITATVRFSAQSFNKQDLLAIVKIVMDGSLPNVMVADQAAIQIINTSPIIVQANGDTSWNISAKRDIIARFDTNALAAKIAGMKNSDAQKEIANLIPQNSPAEIVPFIKGWPRIAFFSPRIYITEDVRQ